MALSPAHFDRVPVIWMRPVKRARARARCLGSIRRAEEEKLVGEFGAPVASRPKNKVLGIGNEYSSKRSGSGSMAELLMVITMWADTASNTVAGSWCLERWPLLELPTSFQVHFTAEDE